MPHVRQPELVGSGLIAVEDDFPARDVLFRNRLPVPLPDGTWPRRSLFGEDGVEPEEPGWPSSLHESTPLFPFRVEVSRHALVGQLANVDLVHLHVLPLPAEDNVLLLLGDVLRASDLQVVVDALHWLVVHIQEQVRRIARDPHHRAEEDRHLLLKWS